MINFKNTTGKFKFTTNSQPPVLRRLDDNSYVVA
jgi:hypothetical protein